jgi:DnaK suppressor protein
MDRNEARDLLATARVDAERTSKRLRLDEAVGAVDAAEAAWADRSLALEERDELHGAAGDADAMLAEITAAEQRLDDGRYGTCERCGQAIPDERLRAIPWVRRCVSHQMATGPMPRHRSVTNGSAGPPGG